MEFLLKAFNQSSYLEDLTGLTELRRLTEETEVGIPSRRPLSSAGRSHRKVTTQNSGPGDRK